MTTPRLYLDHAATGWPKSSECVDAIVNATNKMTTAGRGSYQSATAAQQPLSALRNQLATLINAPNSGCISLHTSGTSALNSMIHGLIRPGDHVVTTAADHNSVLRPLHHLQKQDRVEVTIVACDSRGFVAARDILNSVRENTRLVVMTHASNVTGAVQPIEVVGKALADSGTMFAIDAAQTLGCLQIDVQAASIDLLAAPGHKSAGGPLGTGMLYSETSIQFQIVPTIQGGTGSQSESLEMPVSYPEKLESGNLNVPALAGWDAGLRLVDVHQKSQHFQVLSKYLHDKLQAIKNIQLFSVAGELPIASLQIGGCDVSDVAAILDSQFGIETRAGLHCAALIHPYLKSTPQGTLRISGGRSTTLEDLDRACDALQQIAESV